MDFNLPYYHFSLPSSSTVALKMNSQKGAQQSWSSSKLHSQRIVSINLSGGSLEDPTYKAGCCLFFFFFSKPDMELAQHEKTFSWGHISKNRNENWRKLTLQLSEVAYLESLKIQELRCRRKFCKFQGHFWECRCSDIQL